MTFLRPCSLKSLLTRARAAKEAEKHKGGKSQLGARAAGLQVDLLLLSIPRYNHPLLTLTCSVQMPKVYAAYCKL